MDRAPETRGANAADLHRELRELGAGKKDAIGDQAREQDTVRDEQRREREAVAKESQATDAVGMGGRSSSAMRENCQRKRAQMNNRKYQRGAGTGTGAR